VLGSEKKEKEIKNDVFFFMLHNPKIIHHNGTILIDCCVVLYLHHHTTETIADSIQIVTLPLIPSCLLLGLEDDIDCLLHRAFA
jgi:hypothetical protein